MPSLQWSRGLSTAEGTTTARCGTHLRTGGFNGAAVFRPRRGSAWRCAARRSRRSFNGAAVFRPRRGSRACSQRSSTRPASMEPRSFDRGGSAQDKPLASKRIGSQLRALVGKRPRCGVRGEGGAVSPCCQGAWGCERCPGMWAARERSQCIAEEAIKMQGAHGVRSPRGRVRGGVPGVRGSGWRGGRGLFGGRCRRPGLDLLHGG